MRRFSPTLVGFAAVSVVILFAMGLTTNGIGQAVGLLVVTAVGLAGFASGPLRNRRSAVDPGWTPPARVAFMPSTGHVPAPPARVAAALGRTESRELMTSAAFGVGLGFCLMIDILFGLVFVPDFGGELPSAIELFPIFVHPLVGMTVVAAHRSRTRSVRDGTQELFDTCPTSDFTRTVGHLRTGWVPAVVAVVTVLVLGALIFARADAIYGPMGARQLAHVLGAGVLGIGGVALGVALARWAPWSPVPVVAVVVVGLATIQLSTAGDRGSDGIRQLSTWLTELNVDVRFSAPNWLGHHLWVLALVGLVTVLALLRDDRGRLLLSVGAGLVVVAVVTGIVATRPIDPADAARIADLLANPSAHQSCRHAGIPVCTYVGDEELADLLVPHVAAVVAVLPPGALEGRRLRQGVEVDPQDDDQLDPAIARLVPERVDDGAIPVQLRIHPDGIQGIRFWIGLTAVGITDELRPGSTPSLAGQARGVIAIWAATRGLDDRTATRMATAGAPAGDDGSNGARPWPDACYAGKPPVRWALSDLEAARQLLAAPEADIVAALASGWVRLTDPATTTDDLLLTLGLDPVNTSLGLTPSGTSC